MVEADGELFLPPARHVGINEEKSISRTVCADPKGTLVGVSANKVFSAFALGWLCTVDSGYYNIVGIRGIIIFIKALPPKSVL